MGRNTNMLVGVVIDTSGLVPRADSVVFDNFGKRISKLYARPLVQKSNQTDSTINLNVPPTTRIGRMLITEDIAKGEHIRKYSLEAYVANKWKEIASGQSVGHKRIQAFEPVAASKYRLKITEAKGDIHIKTVGLYAPDRSIYQ